MKFSKNDLLLYGVTDRSWLKEGEPLARRVELALKAGVTMIQLREKELSFNDFVKEAQTIKPLCARFGVPLLINDRVDVAQAVDADGVHVGQEDMSCAQARRILGPGKIIGTSAHSVAEALAAQEAGADYLGCGAVFGTSTKADAGALDRETLRQICQTVSIPVVAIGGINALNLPSLSGTGIAGAAVVSAVFAHEDPTGAVQELLAAVKAAVEEQKQEE